MTDNQVSQTAPASDQVAANELQPQDKEAIESPREETTAGRYFRPLTDIFETEDALMVVMEVPGVDRDNVDIRVENNELTVEARVGLQRYAQLRPVYTEYNVGHFLRSFRLSSVVDQSGIQATLEDGVLTIRLPKAREAIPRRIEVR